MEKAKRSGKGGSYYQAAPDAPRILVAGTDQAPAQVNTKSPEAGKGRKAKATTGDE